MQFRAFEPGIEVNGQTVYAVVDGFSTYKQLPSRFLLESGIGRKGANDLVEIDKDGWYSQQGWLNAFEKISQSVGQNVLFGIGQKIPQNAIFPPWVVDVETAIKSVDVAYHLNHRKQGQVMFNLEKGTMLEGIGHYGFEKSENKPRRIVSVCNNPYPCDFDRGILTTMAKKFAAAAVVAHDDTQPCRQKGKDSCTYLVTW